MCSEVNATTSDNCFFLIKINSRKKKYSKVLFAQEELPKIVDKLVSVGITVKNDVKTANVTII